MAEPLTPYAAAFSQNVFAWPTGGQHTPGVRCLASLHLGVVRHVLDSSAARDAIVSAGLRWPEHTNDLHSVGGVMLARRHAEELVVVGPDAPAFRQLHHSLSSGRAPDAIAIDMSEGMRVLELHGPSLDKWLSHLVDASSIPKPGRAGSCRLADITLLLLRPSADRILAIADRSLSPYLAQWLAFTHEGAFTPA